MLRWAAPITVRIIVGLDGNEIQTNSVAVVAEVAGIVRIDRIAGGIEGDRPVRGSLGAIDVQLKTPVEGDRGPDDLVGKSGALHQVITAVNIAFVDEVGNYVAPAFGELFGRELV